jgi:O-antigen/teichoic acid export membrane protein
LSKSTLYSASYTISEQSILVITGLISITSVPYLFNIYETKGIESAKIFQEKILKFYLFLTLPIVIVLFFFYNEILFYLLSNKYQNGFFILPYISAGAFFIGLSNVFSEVFTLKKKTKKLMYVYFASLSLNIILNYVLVIKYDILGAAIATLCSYILLFILTFILSRELIKLNILKKDLYKLIISIILLSTLCYIIKNSIIINTLYGLLVYIIILFLFYFTIIFSLKYFDLKILFEGIYKINKKLY